MAALVRTQRRTAFRARAECTASTASTTALVKMVERAMRDETEMEAARVQSVMWDRIVRSRVPVLCQEFPFALDTVCALTLTEAVLAARITVCPTAPNTATRTASRTERAAVMASATMEHLVMAGACAASVDTSLLQLLVRICASVVNSWSTLHGTVARATSMERADVPSDSLARTATCVRPGGAEGTAKFLV